MSSSDQPEAHDGSPGAAPGTEQAWLRMPARRGRPDRVAKFRQIPFYEELLAPLRTQVFTLLELGVWRGHSLEMWRDAFPQATIIGVDLQPPDLHLGSRVHIVRGDQTDAALMQRLREEYAPDGFEVIVDDASHFGTYTARSLQILYPEHLRPGGLYCIEDWRTGYMPNWPDGGRMTPPLDVRNLDSSKTSPWTDVAYKLRRTLRRREARKMRPLPGETTPVRMRSHDVGMVGLIKRLIDHTARTRDSDLAAAVLPIDAMTVTKGVVVLRKPVAQPSVSKRTENED
jgi:23S rRNA U2552 (ribose-2'-O)-methylase RlmE/FtsJ